MQDGDAVSADTVEYQIPTMYPVSNAVMFVAGYKGPSLRHVGNVEAELVEFAHKAQRPCRVVSGNVIAYRFKIGLVRNQDLHFFD